MSHTPHEQFNESNGYRTGHGETKPPALAGNQDVASIRHALDMVKESRSRMNKLPYDSPERKRLWEAGMKKVYGGVENWRELHEADMAKMRQETDPYYDTLIAAEQALTLAHDYVEKDELSADGEIARRSNHVNAAIRAALAKVRVMLKKSC